ncbi:trypsin-like serine protease [Hyphomonas sp.]|uniref:trypsin-like serine protease n=1 Tax=Hyphomonas sp. TaxID=87 RepID=UPI003F7064A4
MKKKLASCLGRLGHISVKLITVAFVFLSTPYIVFAQTAYSGTSPAGIDKADDTYSQNLAFLEGDTVDTQSEILIGAQVMAPFMRSTVMIRPQIGAPDNTCSGALIAPNVVVSAAHCYDLGVARRGSRVFVGDNKFVKKWEKIAAPRSLWVKEAKKYSDPSIDLLLLRLDRNVPDIVKPVQLATPEDLSAARAMRAVGFGYTEDGSLNEKVEADIAIASTNCAAQTTAGSSHSDYFGCLAGKELVGGVVRPKSELEIMQICKARSDDPSLWTEDKSLDKLCADTCNGDSGGPAFVPPASHSTNVQDYQSTFKSPENFRIVAVTSRAVDTELVPAWMTREGRMCGNGGIYTLIQGKELEWVKNVVAEWQLD